MHVKMNKLVPRFGKSFSESPFNALLKPRTDQQNIHQLKRLHVYKRLDVQVQ